MGELGDGTLTDRARGLLPRRRRQSTSPTRAATRRSCRRRWARAGARSTSISGAAEIAGGLAVLHPATRRAGRWWLLALLVAVFPANVHMAVSPEQVPGLDLKKIPRWALWARLPLQPLAMLWTWRATR